MMKRILTFLLCGIMLLCFAACNGGNTNKTYDTLFAESPSVFVTENIKSITFYSYYGQGKGSKVPKEDMAEIINWLDSFTIDKEVDDALDGVNTRQVEIEYSNGTVIKEGLDLVVIDGVAYYIKGDKAPDCFEDIISKTSLK